MLDAFAKVVAQADARGQFVSASEIDALSGVVREGLKRIDAVNRISGSASAIVASAARALFAEQPQLMLLMAMPTPTVVWQLACVIWSTSYAILPMLSCLLILVFWMIAV